MLICVYEVEEQVQALSMVENVELLFNELHL